MPIPLILLAAGAIGGGLVQRSRQQTAFNTALGSFTNNPDGVGPPLPGSENGAMLTPTQAAGLQNLYRSNPAQAVQMLNSVQGRNQTAHQNTLTRELQWAQLGNSRDSHILAREQFVEQQRQFGINNDLNVIRARKEAQDLGAIYVNDPLLNGARVRTAAPGSVEWRELQQQAVATGQASNTLNELIVSEAKFGVIRDPSAPGGRRQQSLRTQLVGGIKEMLTLGALDEGVLNFATGLVGSELNVADFILGDDAASLERLLTTQSLFNNQMTLRAEDLRLLTGVNPALVQGFNQVQQESAMLQRFVGERIQNIRQVGGNVSDLIQQPGETFLGNEQRGGPVELLGAPESALSELRGTANVLGSQLDTITSAVIGATLGRFLPR